VAANYPSHREADVALRTGATVHVRPVRPTDEQALLTFLRSLSDDSRVFRFFSGAADLETAARRQSQVDYVDTFGLVVTVGFGGQIVGHAMYARLEDGRAEVALTIADDYQGQGLGTILLGHLAQSATENRIGVFEAVVLPENHHMLDVFRNSGFPIEVRTQPSELHVAFPTALTEEAIDRFDRREQIAAVNALSAILKPRAVAVIGASRQRGTVGGELFHNLLSYQLEGPVYPVNPSATVVQSVPAYPSVEAVPGPVDLAVIAVPSARVVEVAEQCARKGVRALVVVSAGFAEVGAAGRERQDELLRVCRAAGMRLIGPNCIGVLNTDPSVHLDATFGPIVPPAGRVGFASQSGALGLAVIDQARARGLGLSSFVSTGNKADISGNDLLNYWSSDPRTDVILLYLESFGNPRKFARIARQVGREKPIVVVKSGRSTAGARATSSHTGALLAVSDVTVDALFRQSGVIRTDTLAELFDVATLLSQQPPPKGRRVGIVTNVGGPAILCSDTCEAEGLEIPVLTDETRSRLRAILPPEASTTNPVDMLAAATADQYGRALDLVANDPSVDAVIAIFLQPLATQAEDVAQSIAAAAAQLGGRKTVTAVFMSAAGIPEGLRAGDVTIPSFTSPEAAAIALARAARYGEWRERVPEPRSRPEGVRADRGAALVATALGTGGWLQPAAVSELLACYGLPLVEQGSAATPEDAGAIAERLGGKVALKGIAPRVLHKTEAGAIRLGLQGQKEVQSAAEEMRAGLASLGVTSPSFLVQRMAPDGVEMIVGVVQDPQFGPVVACGAGGVMVELLKDVSVRLSPLSRRDTTEMLRELKTFPLLTGFRGAPMRDVAALEDVLLRVSVLAEYLPQVAELDINPLIVHEEGATIVDARIRVEPVEPPLPLGARRR
jgi:acetyl coenzyme A synthetase (ADP forming)-like protein